jgi:hypothetical protein
MGMVQSSGSKLFMVRRTIDRTCAAFRPEVDFDDEGQGGVRSLRPAHVGRLRAWLPQRASIRRPSWRWLRRPVLLNPSLSAGPAAQLPEPASAPRATSAPAPSAKAGLPDEKPSANDAKRKVGAALTATAIAAIIVQASRAQYHAGGRPCACPDDTMRNGRACGGRSAYSRPGGASPGRQRAA